MKIRLASFVHDSIVDGDGLRSVIFVQGCPHNCPGCHNQKAISFKAGTWIDIEDVIQEVLDHNHKRVTFSGGEPFVQAEALYHIGVRLKAEGYSLWSYSGYTIDALLKHHDPYVRKLLELLDILVDGRFILKHRNLAILFRGSTNQRIIDVPASLAANEAVVSSAHKDPVHWDHITRDDDIFI